MMEKSYKAAHARGTAGLDQGAGTWTADTGSACSFLPGGGQGAAITDDVIKVSHLPLPTLAVKT